MKTNHTFSRLALVLGVTGALAGCNDSFMDRYPETSLTEETFFKTVSDLETYTNNMYGYLSGSYWDPATDNSLFVNTSSTFDLLGGTVNTETVGTWSWGDIRNVNYMLARTGNVTGDQADINHYIGLARMYRAKLYYDKVWAYSDVPWYDHDLQTDDTEELYKTQDPRSVVVDNIMADLDFAIANMMGGNAPGRYVNHQLPFVGINYMELAGSKLFTAGIRFRQRMGTNHYVTLTGNTGVQHDEWRHLFDRMMWGGGVSYGYDTFLGPLEITFNYSNITHKLGTYISFGYEF